MSGRPRVPTSESACLDSVGNQYCMGSINIYDHSFFRDSVRRFFRLGLSMRFAELEFSVK